MTIIEPIMLGCALVGAVVGAVVGFSSSLLWGAAGLLGGAVLGGLFGPLVLIFLGFLFHVIVRGPRNALELLRGNTTDVPKRPWR